MADIFSALKRTLKPVVLLVLLVYSQVTSQNHPLLDSDHIPLMGFDHGARYNIQNKLPYYDSLKVMGLEGVMFNDVNQDIYDGFEDINSQMKLIPYQAHVDVYWITQYTDAIYTSWQAHDTSQSDIKAALSFNSSIGERVSGGDTIRTKSDDSGLLIKGPGYRQRIKYAFDRDWTTDIIDYTASFRLKIDQDPSYPDPPQSTQGLTDTICVLKIVLKDIDNIGAGYYEKDSLFWREEPILANQFEFDEWKNFDVLYDYEDLPDSFQLKTDYILSMTDSSKKFAEYVEFYVEWKGVDYARLYFDNVLVSDERGRQLFGSNPFYRNLITNQVQNIYNGSPIFNDTYVDFDSTVVGFYGIDEPETIDNMEPVRKVGELIREETDGERPLFMSAASGWTYTWGNYPFINKMQEFYHRGKPDGFIMQTHIYWTNDLDTTKWRISTSYIPNLISLQTTAPVYYVLVQAGKWLPDIRIEPSVEQLRYSVYLALLYGTKGIFFDQVFWNSSSVTGIINPNTGYSLPLYNEIKDNIYPRTKGLFGKTLRNAQQTYQQAEYNALDPSTITSSSKFQSIEANAGEQQPTAIIDFGFFDDISDSEKDYFMLVSRYYNNFDDYTITLDDLGEYDNWSVKNYVDSSTITVNPNSSGIATFETTIDVGDTKLCSVLPVVKYGGPLTVNDTIDTDITLTDDMTINNGVELIVEGDYTITDPVTLEGTGFITGDGYIYLSGNGTIDINSWSRALFKSKSGNHPKLIWFGYPSGAITVTGYKIYSDYGGWHLLATVEDDVFNYTDTTLTITLPGGQAGTDVQYKVTATYGKHSETAASNIIEYNVPGGEIEKKNSPGNTIPVEYNLEQNYPNPLNPATTINYSIKYDGQVSLKIFDILGKEVETLVDEKKEAGHYSVEFDASALPSGVYIYRIKSGKFTDVKKMILLK